MDIKLETHDRLLVGWSHVSLALPPAVLYWDSRCFRYRGSFARGLAATKGDPADFWLYSEERPYVLLDPVQKERAP